MRPRVLMIAFACNPAGGGEHWLGWGWAEQAANNHDVTLLTWDRYGKEVETAARKFGIQAVCAGVPQIVNRIGDRSTAGRWFRQVVWHRRARRLAAGLHSECPFALVHQTTFHSFRIPFWAANWSVPSVWGPIAGGESTPPGFGPWLGRLRTVEGARGPLNRLALARPAVQRSLRKASLVFVSNHTTLNFLPQWCRDRCRVVPPNALREEPEPPPPRPREPGTALKLLFVGNCVATRSIPLVLDALHRVPALPWTLTVVGSGAALKDWQARSNQLGLGTRVQFTGAVPRTQLRGLYLGADAFVFPALRDSGGSGLLEAMSFGLPVVCCDWGGPAEMVDERSGIKLPVDNPERLIASMGAAFERLHAQPEWRLKLGEAAFERARTEFTWTTKRQVLESAYACCLGRSR